MCTGLALCLESHQAKGEPMKALGVVICVFGAALLVTVGNMARMGEFDTSTVAGMQQLVGGIAGAVIVLAFGFKLANTEPKSDNRKD